MALKRQPTTTTTTLEITITIRSVLRFKDQQTWEFLSERRFLPEFKSLQESEDFYNPLSKSKFYVNTMLNIKKSCYFLIQDFTFLLIYVPSNTIFARYILSAVNCEFFSFECFLPAAAQGNLKKKLFFYTRKHQIS